MLTFQPLELKHIPLVRPYLTPNPQRLCDLTVGGIFIWRDFFGNEVAVAADCLIISMHIFGKHKAYTVPLGERRQEALGQLEEHCKQIGEPLVFCIVGDMDLAFLSSFYPGFHAIAERDYFDYLYEAQDLLTLKGGKHRPTRGNINQFLRDTPNWRFEKITDDNIEAVCEFAYRIEGDNPSDSKTLAAEAVKIREVLDHMDEYNMFGGVLFVGDLVAGFSLGEVEGDTLYIHVEKADTSYRGVYQVLVLEFMKMFGDNPKIAFVNREDDNGDLGLRQSKMTYGPIALISKYTFYTDKTRPEWMERCYIH
ncbi:MAG TPA: phosphatidylglycerol lysyltransferase domain-containing protein [Clostridia bacterium]|nr:phosphatidylglycerol lysyltransferase domain-containing protein [Clostridia bacterium]